MQAKQLNAGEASHLLSLMLRMGEAMIDCGAEILRVEDTLNRIGYACGACSMNVFVITSSIVITMEYAPGLQLTQTRRVRGMVGNDMAELEELNELSREVCAGGTSPAEFERKLSAITARTGSQKMRRIMSLAGYLLASASFAVFFGGSWLDGALAGAAGVLTWLFVETVSPLCMNQIMSQLILSFLSGLCIAFLIRHVPGSHMDKIMIGDIMLLVPGIMFTNALRDMLLGDTLSGLLRMCEAVLLAGMMAVGFIAALWLAGRIL